MASWCCSYHYLNLHLMGQNHLDLSFLHNHQVGLMKIAKLYLSTVLQKVVSQNQLKKHELLHQNNELLQNVLAHEKILKKKEQVEML